MNIKTFAAERGMDVDRHTLGVTADMVRVEAIRWCFHGHDPDRCRCSAWTVLAAPIGHPRDVLRRRQVHGWDALAAAIDEFAEITHLRAEDEA